MSDNKFKGVTCKRHEVFSAGGIRGCKCIRFPGFSKEDLPDEMLVTEIKGLSLSQDLNPNSDTMVYVIFSQVKGDTLDEAQDDTDEKVTMSIRVRQFILQKDIITFVEHLRGDDSKHINEPVDDETSDRTQVVLKLDSDTPFLSLMKREKLQTNSCNPGLISEKQVPVSRKVVLHAIGLAYSVTPNLTKYIYY